MNITQIRHLLRRYGWPAMPVVAGFLALQYIKHHKMRMAGILALGMGFFMAFAFSSFMGQPPKLTEGQQKTVHNNPQSAADSTDAAYSVTDLGTLDNYDASNATSINENDQIVGSVRSGNNAARPVIWRNGKIEALKTPGMVSGFATCINSSGVIVGACKDSAGHSRAVQWQNGKMQTLESADGNDAMAYHINAAGLICGWASLKAHQPYSDAALWTAGKLHFLPVSGYTSSANGVNEKGEVVGGNQVSGMIFDSFRYYKGRVEVLPSLGGYGDAAFAINKQGQVAGFSEYHDKFEGHAVLITGKSVRDLGTLGGKESSANALNDKGEVVGWSQDRSGQMVPFLWQRSKLTALNDLIPANSGWKLLGASAINNQGQIVGSGLHQGHKRAFLLIPLR